MKKIIIITLVLVMLMVITGCEKETLTDDEILIKAEEIKQEKEPTEKPTIEPTPRPTVKPTPEPTIKPTATPIAEGENGSNVYLETFIKRFNRMNKLVAEGFKENPEIESELLENIIEMNNSTLIRQIAESLDVNNYTYNYDFIEIEIFTNKDNLITSLIIYNNYESDDEVDMVKFMHELVLVTQIQTSVYSGLFNEVFDDISSEKLNNIIILNKGNYYITQDTINSILMYIVHKDYIE